MSNSLRVINGTIVPDMQSVLTVLNYTVADLKADPEKMTRFKADPRGYLGALGLNADIQREALSEAGLLEVAKVVECGQTCGMTGCVCSDCCLTCWFSVW
jgi:hypothetical protein